MPILLKIIYFMEVSIKYHFICLVFFINLVDYLLIPF